MKKLKIMLLSLALFAVVGGALAFKAKFNKSYCYTQTVPDGSGGWKCPDVIDACDDLPNYSTQFISGKATSTYCYTETVAGVDCSAKKDCNIFRVLTTNN